jgi:hypothetical protein
MWLIRQLSKSEIVWYNYISNFADSIEPAAEKLFENIAKIVHNIWLGNIFIFVSIVYQIYENTDVK